MLYRSLYRWISRSTSAAASSVRWKSCVAADRPRLVPFAIQATWLMVLFSVVRWLVRSTLWALPVEGAGGTGMSFSRVLMNPPPKHLGGS